MEETVLHAAARPVRAAGCCVAGPDCAGEREANLAGFRRLLDAAVTVLQPDFGCCGGLATA